MKTFEIIMATCYLVLMIVFVSLMIWNFIHIRSASWIAFPLSFIMFFVCDRQFNSIMKEVR